MKIIEFWIIIAYLLFCIILGLVTQKRISASNEGVDEYYTAGRRIGTGINSLAVLAAVGSGGSFMAGVGTVWNLGIPFFTWLALGTITGLAVASILVARPMRNSKKLTVPDFITDRYSGSLFFKIAIPLVIIIGSGMFLMSQMKAGGLITSYITGLNYQWGLVIITLVFILYVSMGGMLAVTWTNVLQGALMLVLTAVMVVGCLMNLPVGWSDYLTGAASQNTKLGTTGATIPLAGYIGAFVTWVTAVCVTPHIIMRAFTSTDERSARLSLNISMLIYGTCMLLTAFLFVPFIPTLGEMALQSNPSDMWMLLVAEQFFGPLLLGIIAAGIMAAIMSSTDALLLALSSAVAYDLYKGVIKTDANRSQILKVSMAATWVLGIIVMILAFNPPQFLIVLNTSAVGFMVSALFSPLVLGIWWKRANTPGAITGLTVGAIVYFILFLGFEMPYNTEVLIALPMSLISMMVVSSLTEWPSEEVISKVESYHSY